MPDRLTIVVTPAADNADARPFARVFEDVLDALDSLAKVDGVTGDWEILSLEKRSPPRVTIGSRMNVAVLAILLTGMRQLETGTTSVFDPTTTKIVKRLGDRLGRQVDGVSLQLDGEEAFQPTSRMARNAGQSIQIGYYTIETSIDGKLDIVNVRKGAKFSIFDDVDNRLIKCTFAEHLLDLVKQNIGKRITAIGTVKYNKKTDQPVSIIVDLIDPLEDDTTPAYLADMPPIRFPGELTSEEYVRRLRDGR